MFQRYDPSPYPVNLATPLSFLQTRCVLLAPSHVIHTILKVWMDLPWPPPVGRQRPAVYPNALTDNISVVSRRTDAHSTSGPAKHVAQIVRDGLQLRGCVVPVFLPEDLVKEDRVVGWASSS